MFLVLFFSYRLNVDGIKVIISRIFGWHISPRFWVRIFDPGLVNRKKKKKWSQFLWNSKEDVGKWTFLFSRVKGGKKGDNGSPGNGVRRLNMIQRSQEEGERGVMCSEARPGSSFGLWWEASFRQESSLQGWRCLLPAQHFTPAFWPESFRAARNCSGFRRCLGVWI